MVGTTFSRILEQWTIDRMREANVSVNEAGLEAMGIGELLALGRDAGLRELEELACHGTGAVVRVTTESRYDEERLSALDYVDQWEHVACTAEGHVYVIAFTAPQLPDELGEETDELVGTCDPTLGSREATMSLVGPQASIASTIDTYESAGISPELRALGAYTGRRHPLDRLTDRQREVLQTAYEMGYYEVPRDASTADVAGALDLDPSTVTEHLQRAERNAFEALLSSASSTD